MGWREKYRTLPRKFSGHAKKQLATRLISNPEVTMDMVIDWIVNKATLINVHSEGTQFVCEFAFNGWTAIGLPQKKHMVILTVYPSTTFTPRNQAPVL